MAPEVTDLIEAGLALDSDERAVVAHALFNSLHGSSADQHEVDAAWAVEISTRADDVVAGRVGLVDADEHYSRLRAELAPRRG